MKQHDARNPWADHVPQGMEFEAYVSANGAALTNTQFLRSLGNLRGDGSDLVYRDGSTLLAAPGPSCELHLMMLRWSVDREIRLTLLDASGGNTLDELVLAGTGWLPYTPFKDRGRRCGLNKTLFATTSGGAAAGVFTGSIVVYGQILNTERNVRGAPAAADTTNGTGTAPAP